MRWELAEWEPDVRALAERGEKCSAKMAAMALDEIHRLEQALKDAEPAGSSHDHVGALTNLVDALKRDKENSCTCGRAFSTPQGLGLHFKAGKCKGGESDACPKCGGGTEDGGCIGFGGGSGSCGWRSGKKP